MLMDFASIWIILKLVKVFAKTAVFRDPKTAVSVLASRLRPRSEPRTLDRLPHRQGHQLEQALLSAATGCSIKSSGFATTKTCFNAKKGNVKKVENHTI